MDVIRAWYDSNKKIRIVVALRTSCWADSRGLHMRRDLCYLKRKCVGFNFLDEDSRCVGPEEVVPRVVNLNEVPDGEYEVVIVNHKYDWESGMLEDYDYKLVPVTEQSERSKDGDRTRG